jgi:DNA-binding CsgD family transcriptional regulator
MEKEIEIAEKEPSTKKDSRKWSERDVLTLQQHLPECTLSAFRKKHLPHKSLKSIERKAKREGVSHIRKRAKDWSDLEKDLIKKHLPDMTPAEFKEAHTPTRSTGAILRIAHSLGVRPVNKKPFWSDAERSQLAELAETHTSREIASALGRSMAQVNRVALSLGVTIKYRNAADGKKHKVWTGSDRGTLFTLAGTIPRKVAAQRMGRTETALALECSRQGLRWMQGTLTLKQAADLLHVHETTVQKHRDKLRQKWRKVTKKGLHTQGPTRFNIQAVAKSILEETRGPTVGPTALGATSRHLKRLARGDFDMHEAMFELTEVEEELCCSDWPQSETEEEI